jgi:hypothetical protein
LLTPDGWFRTFLDDPRGTLQVGTRNIRINGIPATSKRIRDAMERAYVEKYPTPGSRHYVRGFRTKRRRDASIEFVPR